MATKSKTEIPWCDVTWNPIVGCFKISEGCENCYALAMARRLAANPKTKEYYYGLVDQFGWTGICRAIPERLYWPSEPPWKYGSKVFVNSMGDLFHPAVLKMGGPIFANTTLAVLFAQMMIGSGDLGYAKYPPDTYLILTKRPAAMRDFMIQFVDYYSTIDRSNTISNIWLGVTAENQRCWDERVPILMHTPGAAKRFVSVEPMLEPIVMGGLDDYLSKIDWVICGPENGPKKRPFREQWALDLRDQCRAAGIPFFYKGGMLDGKEYKEFPK